MPTITRKQLNEYISARDEVIKAVTAGLSDDLLQLNYDDIAAARKTVIRILNGRLTVGADTVARLSAEFYDLVREISTGERLGARAYVTRNPDATEGFVRAEIQKVTDDDGDPSRFIRGCNGRVTYELQKQAAETTYQNGYRDPHRVLYARVPSGIDTCKFCNMLASRGAVYLTAKSAGEGDHWHDNCQCTVVPMWDNVRDGWSRSRSISTTIEGYDPDALYDQFLKDIDDGSLKRSKLTEAAIAAHRRNKYKYVR